MRTPTLRDVAEAAGVHAATASRALNPATRRLVSAETARRVLRAAEALGFQPNPIARSLKTSKSGTVGLVLPDITNPLFPPIVRGIEDVLTPAGYSAWIVNTDNDLAREETQVELGKRFGISQMQVSRRLSRILVWLQRRLLDEEVRSGDAGTGGSPTWPAR